MSRTASTKASGTKASGTKASGTKFAGSKVAGSNDAYLARYQAKRDFARSPEPAGGLALKHAKAGRRTARARHPIFVIQQHAARSMHFDVRLEIAGVLKSWAVPKGPSLDPSVRRLAVATEDHPMEYAKFEGIIPKGEYGGGTVIVWDQGTYRDLSSGAPRAANAAAMQQAYDKGRLDVWFEGRKLRGGWLLVEAPLAGASTKGRNWLLIKRDDETADARRNPVVTEPESVLSGHTIRSLTEAGTVEVRARREALNSGSAASTGRAARAPRARKAASKGGR